MQFTPDRSTIEKLFNTLDLHDHSKGRGLPVKRIGDGAELPWRTLTIFLLNEDGTVSTTQLQVVALADENGNPVDVPDVAWQGALLEELAAVRRGIEEIVGHPLRIGAV